MIKTLRKFWKGVTSNPMYAIGAIGAGGALAGMLAPEWASRQISFLDMDPTLKPGSPIPGTKDLAMYGHAGGRYTAATLKPATFLGKSQGLLYDVRKKLGQFVSSPLKFGKLFSESGAGYKYLFGQGTWGQLKQGLQGVLPFKVGAQDAQHAYNAWSAGFSSNDRGGGGGGITPVRSRSRTYGAGSQAAGLASAGRVNPYRSQGISANLLKKAYKDDYLHWIDRQTRMPVRSGPNISYKTSISVGGRYTRTR